MSVPKREFLVTLCADGLWSVEERNPDGSDTYKLYRSATVPDALPMALARLLNDWRAERAVSEAA